MSGQVHPPVFFLSFERRLLWLQVWYCAHKRFGVITSLSWQHEFGAQCRLGESPVWLAEQNALYWADIKQGRVHRLDWATRAHHIFQLDIAITALVRRSAGGFVAASTTGLYTYDARFEHKQFLVDPCAQLANVRLNDAVVDRDGRLWTGSLNPTNLPAPDGCLYRVDADHSVHLVDSGFSVANGIAFSPQGDTLYVSNMLQGEVFAYELERRSGEVRNKRVFTRVPAALGFPDGLTVDSSGHVWVGHWKGKCLTRHHPVTGESVEQVDLPVTNVTRGTFGGPALNRLIVTTAWHAVEADLPNQPLAGDVFSVALQVAGLADEQYGG